jgi:uncharacterized protein
VKDTGDAHEEHARRVERLHARLRACGPGGLAIAFSGGVDSSVLLHAARAVLGDAAVALIADSPSLPRAELLEAERVAGAIGARLERLSTDELALEAYRRNAGDRCYHCRRTLFDAMEAWARERGFRALAYGEITDDLVDDRPGRRAASELGVVAPLREAGLSKEDVRRYARAHGLATAEKPASACLASRIPVGTEVTRARLDRIERAEALVRSLGFRVLRVRDHGSDARVEVGADELARARALRDELAGLLRPLGFERVELAAYRSPVAAPR